METILERVKKSGLSQKKIAEKLGITNVHLNYMLNGKQPMQLKYEIEILSLLNKLK